MFKYCMSAKTGQCAAPGSLVIVKSGQEDFECLYDLKLIVMALAELWPAVRNLIWDLCKTWSACQDMATSPILRQPKYINVITDARST